MKPSSACALFCTLFLLFSQAASPQDFSSIDRDLAQLEDLKANLDESGNIIAAYENTIQEQEKLLLNLQTQLNAMSEIYMKQSNLSLKYEKSSKFWRVFTLTAIPVIAVISGVTVWAVMR